MRKEFENIEVNLEERYLRPQIKEALQALGIEDPSPNEVKRIFDSTKELIASIDIGVRPHLEEFARKQNMGEIFKSIEDFKEARNAAYHWGIRTLDEIELKENEVVLLCWNLFNSGLMNAHIDLASHVENGDDEFTCLFNSYPLVSFNHMTGKILPHSNTLMDNKPFITVVEEGERVIFKTRTL